MRVDNFRLFVFSLLITGFIGLIIFLLWNFYERLINKIMIFRIKKKIYQNPFIGEPDRDNIYLYNENRYHLRYKIETSQKGGKKLIEWISIRYLSKPSVAMVKKIKNSFAIFFHNKGWVCLFRPFSIFLSLFAIAVFYFGLIESRESKIARLEWIVSRALGVDSTQIRYAGGGWFDMFGNRKIVVDGKEEPFIYTINLWQWLYHEDAGYIMRQREAPYGDDINTLRIDSRRNIWLHKDGQWHKGSISGNKIAWETPQGTGVREGKILGHEVLTDEGDIYLLDN